MKRQSPPGAARAVLVSLLGACAFASLAPQIAHAGLEGRRAHDLHIFAGGSDGATPSWGVVRDAQGNLYGTTLKGGAYNDGTLYKIAPDGSYDLLYAFGKHSGGGAGPDTPVILADGSLVGSAGRADGQTGSVIYKISPGGRESVLHRFGADDPLGYASWFGLTADGSGNLYGVTTQGGPSSCGAVFRLNTDGTADRLHAFNGGASDGCSGAGPVTFDAAGNLYGVARVGGEYNAGVVYEIAPDGTETVLHAFGDDKQDDGSRPSGPLLLDAAGNLYGTTTTGSNSETDGGGTVYKIAPDGTETLLHRFGFSGGVTPPGEPVGGVIADADGNLYGTTLFGGAANNGVVFKLSPGGRMRILHSFYGVDGAYPISVIFGANGSLVGATQDCGVKRRGTCEEGTVFKITLH